MSNNKRQNLALALLPIKPLVPTPTIDTLKFWMCFCRLLRTHTERNTPTICLLITRTYCSLFLLIPLQLLTPKAKSNGWRWRAELDDFALCNRWSSPSLSLLDSFLHCKNTIWWIKPCWWWRVTMAFELWFIRTLIQSFMDDMLPYCNWTSVFSSNHIPFF